MDYHSVPRCEHLLVRQQHIPLGHPIIIVDEVATAPDTARKKRLAFLSGSLFSDSGTKQNAPRRYYVRAVGIRI